MSMEWGSPYFVTDLKKLTIFGKNNAILQTMTTIQLASNQDKYLISIGKNAFDKNLVAQSH